MHKKVQKGLWISAIGCSSVILTTPLLVGCSCASVTTDSLQLSLSAPGAVDAGQNLTLTVHPTYSGTDHIAYQWQCKKVTDSDWTFLDGANGNLSNDGQTFEFPSIGINYDQAQVKVTATTKNGISATSNIVKLSVNQTNPVSALSLQASQNVYRPGETVIVYSDVSTNSFAISDPSNIQYTWKIKQPGQNWTPIPNCPTSVLKLNDVSLDYNNCQIQAIATYQNFDYPSDIYTLKVSAHATPAPDQLPNIHESNSDLPQVHAAISGYSQEQVANDSITAFGMFNRVEMGQHARPVTPGFYDSQMYQDYHDSYGFVYPAQNYNYEWTGPNSLFPNKPKKEAWGIFHNKKHPSQTIDATALLLNEQVLDKDKNGLSGTIRYNDGNWIKQQINNNQLRRHRASENFYLNSMDNIPVTQMHYEVSTAITGHEAIGLYAPAGEVVTFTFDQDTWDLMQAQHWSDFQITINQNYWDNKAPDDSGRISNRYPYVRSTFGISLDAPNRQVKVGSPFGGSLGIRIGSRLNKAGNFPLDSQVQNLKFSVDGAIKCMFYQDGFTTVQDWSQQIIDVQQQKLAPVLQGITPYNTLTIPFTDLNMVGHKPVQNLIYPKESFKKWDDFLYLSNFYAGRDKNLQRLDMEFCDDIWGGAAAWGGGMTFYCPTGWGVDSMFYNKPIDVFNSANSWGVFHEINHNFQQDAGFFNRRTHGETNQVTGFDLSVISDAGRFRSELNWCGEQNKDNRNLAWSRLNNPFTVMKYSTTVGQVNDEYLIYAILLFTLGSKQYVDYLRDDVAHHPSNANGWTGFSEIQRLSDTFKLNFWPAFWEFGNDHWSDSWPTLTNPPTPAQQQVIDQLSANYPAVDFVANQYAAGIYMYDKDSQTYQYTHDVVNPYEIPAGHPYNFDLENFIVSVNPNFTWNSLLFEPTTKLGGKLSLDPNNPKRLIYTPPANNLTGIDEFDLGIIPGTWDGKPSHYVPAIKWKIKIRQVLNEPIIETFQPFGNTSTTKRDLNSWFNFLKTSPNYQYQLPLISFNTNMFLNPDQYEGVKIRLKFIAPQAGHYVFSNKWDDAIRMYVNGQNVPIKNQDTWSNDQFVQTYSADLQANQALDFEFLVINLGGVGRFNMGVTVNNQSLDLLSNVVSPDFNTIIHNSLTPTQVINDPSFQYTPRLINREIFNKDFSANVNLSQFNTPIYDPSQYKLSSSNPTTNRYLDNLNNYNNVVEVWNQLDNLDGTGCKFQFQVQFPQPTPVGAIIFGNPNKHWDFHPQTIKVTGYPTSGQTNPIILYDGVYPDRNGSVSAISCNQLMTVDHLAIELTNQKTNGSIGMLLQWLRISSLTLPPKGASIAFNNPHVDLNGDWAFRHNDDLNLSAINNLYCVSTSSKDFLEVSFKNLEQFRIVGQTNPTKSEFEVFVNNQKLDTVSVISSQTLFNQCLYTYQFDHPTDVTIKIRHNDANPLFLNYIETFGPNIKLN